MIYGSVCSGIEAASVAWKPLGWTPAFFSEIDKAPRAVLAHRFPGVPIHGDFTTIKADDYGPIDLLVGGTPCQSFSVAGKRAGLDDARGNLAVEFFRLAQRLRPKWIVWENVPGLLSSNKGRDFGALLSIVGECGFGWAYRVLDAVNTGVPQRRRRVFLVGYFGDWRPAAAVLFKPESLRWDTPARGKARQDVAGTPSSRTTAGGGLGTDFELGGGLVAIAYRTSSNCGAWETGDRTDALTTSTDPNAHVVAFALRGREHGAVPEINGNGDTIGALRAASGGSSRDYLAFKPSHYTLGKDGAPSDTVPPLSADADKRDQDPVVLVKTRDGAIVNGNADEADAIKALRTLLDTDDEKAFYQWALGILAAFWPQEVLQHGVYGEGIRRASIPKRGLINVSLSCAKDGAAWSVRDLWQAGCDGCPPCGWQPHEQLASKLGSHLSRLPYSPSPAERFLHYLWQACEGSWLLRQALSKVQKARQSACSKGEPVQQRTIVRRLTVEECEALQGFPRSWTDVPYGKGRMSDSQRYKMIGNSMAVPVMRQIGERIAMVQSVLDARERDNGKV
jgi:DNA (cytosine-5)-methyltransferase 1